MRNQPPTSLIDAALALEEIRTAHSSSRNGQQSKPEGLLRTDSRSERIHEGLRVINHEVAIGVSGDGSRPSS